MKKVKLEEVSEIYGGYAFKSKDFGVGENFVVKIKDIKPPIIDIENADKVDVTKYSIKKMEKYKVFPDDIVIAMTGATIGKVGRNKSGRILYLNQRVAKITPNIKEDLDFIYYCISNNIFLEYVLNNLDSNSAQGNISHFGIGNFEINWYDRETRQKIAQILSCLDDKIEILHQINDNLAELAKTIYDYWFVQFDFPDENGKPYKTSGGKMVYNEVLKREIPEGWEVKKLGEILKKNETTIKINAKDYLSSGSIPIIDQSSDFICGYTNEISALIKASNIPAIIFGDHTRILKFIDFDFARGADGTQILFSNNEKMPQYLFYHSLLKIDLSNYGYARHFKFLKEQKILLSDRLIAEKFTDNVKTIYEKIKINRNQIQHLQSLRDWLLPMLMNGQISVE